MRVYISGPISGTNDYVERFCNLKEFRKRTRLRGGIDWGGKL